MHNHDNMVNYYFLLFRETTFSIPIKALNNLQIYTDYINSLFVSIYNVY